MSISLKLHPVKLGSWKPGEMPPETLEETTRNHKVVPDPVINGVTMISIGIVITPATHLYPFLGVRNNNPSHPFIAGSYGSHLVASSFRSTINLEKPRLHQETKRSEGFQNETTNVSKDIWQLLFFHMVSTVWHAQKRPEPKIVECKKLDVLQLYHWMLLSGKVISPARPTLIYLCFFGVVFCISLCGQSSFERRTKHVQIPSHPAWFARKLLWL